MDRAPHNGKLGLPKNPREPSPLVPSRDNSKERTPARKPGGRLNNGRIEVRFAQMFINGEAPAFAPLMFAFTENQRWQPGIGDPSFMGWLTVLAYFIAAALCCRSAIHEHHRNRRGDAVIFWFLLGSFLAILGLNKQLDLQTWFTLSAKQLALHQGWYEQRAIVQTMFIGLVAVLGIATFAAMCWLTRSALRQNALALSGSLFLACFVLIRASSFHHVDALLGFDLAGFKINWALELSGIGLVGMAAFRNRRAQAIARRR